MTPPPRSRYAEVSRRSMLKALGGGALAALGVGCAAGDTEILAGAVAEPAPTTLPPTTTTTTTSTTAPADTTPASAVEEPAATEPTPERLPADTALAVGGQLVVSFTYTQAAGGKNEFPYVAVWIEDADGALVETVALFYELGRRGQRWLDHLDRWHGGGGTAETTISSATRPPGEYAVVWDGTAAGTPVAAGDYFVCIEAVREDGPHSLIRESFSLDGALAETAMAPVGELSAASVRIDV